jgi:hypothetical protein
MREAIVNDCLYLSRVESINVGYLLDGQSRLVVVDNEVTILPCQLRDPRRKDNVES